MTEGSNPKNLPFLAREMLDFGDSSAFGLQINCSPKASASATIFVRGVTKFGPFTYQCAVTAAGGQQDFNFVLPDIPIFLSITQANTITVMNGVWVCCRLTVNGDVGVVLTQGYPNTNTALSWPVQQNYHRLQLEGDRTQVTGVDPSAGANLSFSVPAGAFYEIVGVKFLFTAAVAVANRRPSVRATFGGNVLFDSAAPADITASQAVTCSFFQGASVQNDATGLRMNAPLPNTLLLEPGTVISTNVANIQGADTITAVVVDLKAYYLT